jgi:uncharacterized protein (DUF433 family)
MPLGVGLYTTAEAALYAGIKPAMMSRWIHGGGASEPALRAQLPGNQNKIVTFLDLIQSLAVRSIRIQAAPVPLQKIRDAVDTIKEKYRIDFPFARKHTTYIYGKDVLIEIPGDGLIQVTGKHANHYMMKKVIEMYMERVEYGENGLATKYTAYQSDGVQIVMNPKVRFGEPVVSSCGYTARALYDACIAEGGYDAAAKAYEVSPSEVRVAFQYIDSLEKPSA